MNKELVEKMYHKLVGGDVAIHTSYKMAKELAAVASEHYGDKWLKVEDGLPEVSPANKDVSVNVLVIEQGEQYIGWYSFDLGFWVEAIECVPMYKATHWQPLPPNPHNNK